MADPTLSSHLLIMLSMGGDPEVFGFTCGANAQSVTFTNNTGEQALLDCDDPLNVTPALQKWTESKDTSISVSGRVSKESFDEWRDWSDTGAVKNIRVEIMNTAALGGGYYQLPAILQSLEIGREGLGSMTFSATIVGAGQRTWVPHP